MKKVLYVIFLIAEWVVGFLLVSLAWVNVSWIPGVITIVVWAALLTWQLVCLRNANSDSFRRKALRNIALVMLIPTVGAIIMLAWLLVGLMSAI